MLVAQNILVFEWSLSILNSGHRLQALDWADRIVKDWRFRRVITCHLDSPIATSPKEFRACFAFLEDIVPSRRKKGLLDIFKAKTQNTGFVEEDFATLRGLDAFLVNLGVVNKSGE
jgi:hypothetical protein